jgi:hypothetical protein
VVFPISDINTLQITYDVTWENFRMENGVVPPDWCWDRFKARAHEDQISMPAAFSQPGDLWNPFLRKENNSLRIILNKGQTWGPENEGPVIAILFGPLAEIKLRTTAPDPIEQINDGIASMYRGRYRIIEEVSTREWALVASFGDDSRQGAIPIHYRVPMPKALPQEVKAVHARLLETALRTQNYDRGLDKFVRKNTCNSTRLARRCWLGGFHETRIETLPTP